MIIINADDWGRTKVETDVALACCKAGSVTSVSAMVFMEDSERAAALAREHGVDTGLHLNLSQHFTAATGCGRATESHNRIVRFLTWNKYAQILYHPLLRDDFHRDYQMQLAEFVRIYGKAPSHIDGHQHMHLCSNMVLDKVIPNGERLRRTFSFWPGERGLLNRTYRRLVDRILAARYRLTDYFFALSQNQRQEQLQRISGLSSSAKVELMTHPAKPDEYAVLMGDTFRALLAGLDVRPYTAI